MGASSLVLGLVLTLAVLMSHGGVMGRTSEAELLEKLMTNYPKDHGFVRPVQNSSQTVNITLNLMLLQILTFDQVKQVMTVRAWTSLDWRDAYLSWDPADYDGVQQLVVSKDQVWTPDVVLFNAVSAPKLVYDVQLAVTSTGKVHYVPAYVLEFACDTNPEENRPNCNLKFGSWTMHEGQLNLTSQSNRINADFYIPHQEWELGRTAAEKHTEEYGLSNVKYSDITYSFDLIRRQPVEDEEDADDSAAGVIVPLISSFLLCVLPMLLRH